MGAVPIFPSLFFRLFFPIEIILKTQNKWKKVTERYYS